MSETKAKTKTKSKTSVRKGPLKLDPKGLGKRGERAAKDFLVNKGYEILETNWSCFAGEADIIARDGVEIVFVEVKTRTDLSAGFPEEAVTAQKRDKYEKIASLYLESTSEVDVSIRFDVVSILKICDDRGLLRHHINAFSKGECN